MEHKRTVIDEVRVDESGTILISMRKIHTVEEHHRTSIPPIEGAADMTAEELAEEQLDHVNRHLKAQGEAEVSENDWVQVRHLAKGLDVKAKRVRKFDR